MSVSGAPSSSNYNFNSFQEIKSHSSILYNERMAILFYLLDIKSLNMHQTKTVSAIYEVYAIIQQIYKNIRMLVRFNPIMRKTMNLETKDEGIYTTDIAKSLIEKMIKYCEINEFTIKRIDIIIEELDNFETVLKDTLQYFSYFIRPDFRQKPDIEMATEKYKQIADKATIEELKELVGKSHKIDFESLGSERIEIQKNTEVEYNPEIDGSLDEYKNEDDELFIDDEDDKY